MKIAKHISNMPRAGIRVIFDMASKMQDVIHLEIGSPDLPTPPPVCEAGIRAIRNGETRYTPNAGLEQLRSRIASYVSGHKGVDVGPANVVVTTGGMGGLASVFAAVLDPGDEVLVPDPGWPNYSMQVTCCGATPIPYSLEAEEGFRVAAAAIRNALTPRTKAIVVNSPSNPTGSVIDDSTVEEVLAIAGEQDVLVVADEVYEEIVFNGINPSFLRPGHIDNVVGVYSFSKTWSMTGWRVGYVVASIRLAEEVAKLQEVYYACAASISQHAALAALAMEQAYVRGIRDIYQSRRDVVVDELTAANVPFVTPEGAFYCLIDVSAAGMTSQEFAVELLNSERVAVAPGETFGRNAKGMVRICFAADETKLRDGLGRMIGFLQRHC